MSQNVARRLRPYLFTSFLRFQFHASRRTFAGTTLLHAERGGKDGTNDYKRRVSQLQETRGAIAECYPRLDISLGDRTSIKDFRTQYDYLKPSEEEEDNAVIVAGRIHSVRSAGNKLLFLDLKQGEHTLQAICQLNNLDEGGNSRTLELFKTFAKTARKGDWYEIRGHANRSPRAELSILARAVPKLLSPSLHQIPDVLEDTETRARSRHVDMLVHPVAIQTLRVRHEVEQHLISFFNSAGFTMVHTPILASGAGGAIARPFETHATELDSQTLNLRIAPELWLKRLIVGGMERIYEIGPAFRNEGVDATHNPEFYICEFYEAFATLEDLMSKTERLLETMSERIESHRSEMLKDLPPPGMSFTGPFARLQFIPTLEREMGCPLPDLSNPKLAEDQVLSFFREKGIQLPSNRSLPHLLDTLAATYIEPLCDKPTFVTHHPACLSPLSLHINCPQTGQRVAARAELFVRGREIANMYEEENSPFEQRRKLMDQLQDREGDGKRREIDESYLEALEWGLPPTGGWGCGIERLVMLFSGQGRIADVLPFGSLRNVVGLGRR